MDETRRQQTTKGELRANFVWEIEYKQCISIWMCRDKDMNVIVMDVEGTDGRERGEDQVYITTIALFLFY